MRQEKYPEDVDLQSSVMLSEQELTARASQRLKSDLDSLECELFKFTLEPHVFIKRKDQQKLAQEKERSSKMKKSQLQRSFKVDANENAERFNELLNDAYTNNKHAKAAIDSHMHLLESIQKSDSIKAVEKHQRKSLGQVRSIINEVCTRKKMRKPDGFQSNRVTSTAKAPNMKDVKAVTQALNKNIAKHMLNEINEHNSKNGISNFYLVNNISSISSKK